MRSSALGLVAAVLLAPACAGPQPPAEPFGEFSVTRSGGVAGVREVLRVRPDGVAVVTSPRPAAGRLDDVRLAGARRLLESDELRREAGDAGRREPERACSDQFSRSVTMGSLSLSVTEPCRSGSGPSTPAFDELLGLVADAAGGRFDAPLRPGDVPEVTLRVDEAATSSRPARTLELASDGTATARRPGAATVRVRVPDADRDALALVGDGLLGQPATPCSAAATWTLTVVAADGRRSVGSDCGFGARGVDARALVGTLDRALVDR